MKIKDKYWVNNDNFDGPYDPETEECFYDLIDGVYLLPEEVLDNPNDAYRVSQAIKLIEEFRNSLQDIADKYEQEVEEGYNEEEDN